eukprot:CAMPEP_0182428656 /NCGR_PEP_ID=MMETSP1167-20130531/23184_1 /TAXON_ID=2988 /ORGANISM="Mallomonas Sp, Strain CCMP3275" /LENGTH=71 /DNA_ID=CAMNT_0024611667 /DNA_START=361 /DNA_END=576 /DNA_ORIENTATION=+
MANWYDRIDIKGSDKKLPYLANMDVSESHAREDSALTNIKFSNNSIKLISIHDSIGLIENGRIARGNLTTL